MRGQTIIVLLHKLSPDRSSAAVESGLVTTNQRLRTSALGRRIHLRSVASTPVALTGTTMGSIGGACSESVWAIETRD